MRRAVTAVAVAGALALAPGAEAALVEVPVEPLPANQVATCLRSAETTVALWGATGVDLFAAGAAGVARQERIPLGRLGECAAVAGAPGGAAVAAGWRRGQRAVLAAVRDPGGGFGAPARVGSGQFPPSVSAAVSAAGHAVVAWYQRRGAADATAPMLRLVAVRRAPGGAFGPVEPLTPWRRAPGYDAPIVRAAVDAAGVATVAWLRPLPDSGDIFPGARLEVGTAAPGTAFARARVGQDFHFVETLALSVAPDGWALVAHDGDGDVRAYERPPGAARFTQALANMGAYPTVAARDGGGGVIAWRGDSDVLRASVHAAVRSGSGKFGPPEELAPRREAVDGGFIAVAELIAVGGPPLDPGNAALRAVLAPDGRALLAWGAARAGLNAALTPRIATGTIGAGFGTFAELGSRVRDVYGLAPLFLPDGRPALAWTDNAGRYDSTQPSGGGRLHLAVDAAAPAPSSAPPRLIIQGAPVQRLFPWQGPRVLVTCDRACDVRATIPGAIQAAVATLAPDVPTALRLPAPFERSSGTSRVKVTASAAGGTRVERAVRRVRVIKRKPPPPQLPLDVRARRDGDEIVVRWRTAKPARFVSYLVQAGRWRGQRFRGVYAGGFTMVDGGGRRRFVARLRRPGGGVRWITVTAFGYSGRTRPVIVPVG